MKQKKVIIFTGPSGVGKGTIEKIIFQNKELNLALSVSATTRGIRSGEEHGKHYFFISKEQFKKDILDNKFIEYNKHFDNYYGTYKAQIDRIISNGFNAFLEIETHGALNVLKYYKEHNELDQIISIFIAPPSIEILKDRILERGTESAEQLEMRLNKAKEELKNQEHFKHIVVNDDVQRAADEVAKIILEAIT